MRPLASKYIYNAEEMVDKIITSGIFDIRASRESLLRDLEDASDALGGRAILYIKTNGYIKDCGLASEMYRSKKAREYLEKAKLELGAEITEITHYYPNPVFNWAWKKYGITCFICGCNECGCVDEFDDPSHDILDKKWEIKAITGWQIHDAIEKGRSREFPIPIPIPQLCLSCCKKYAAWFNRKYYRLCRDDAQLIKDGLDRENCDLIDLEFIAEKLKTMANLARRTNV